MTTRLNTPWTAADIQKMRKLAKARISARIAAKALKRTRGSVAFKAMTLGIRFMASEQPPGTQKRRFRKGK